MIDDPAPAPLAERLEPGWYWVSRFGEWEAMRSDGKWVSMPTTKTITRITPDFKIGPRIPSPDEPPTLLAALDGREAGWNEAIEAAARVADGFTCGGCGMDGKSSAAIRALARPQPAGEAK